jgi:beta-glucosidase
MSHIQFPEDFHWGASTAAYSVEGAWKERGDCIWDAFCRAPGVIRDGSSGDTACNSVARYPDDVVLLKRMNLTSYRFSISWPRVQPLGHGDAHAAGLDYYRWLVDALLDAGIRPLPSLYHWDLPQRLESRGGWPERDTAGRFADYADLVARALGDRISDWLLFSEPLVFTAFGYMLGLHAPGRRSADDFLRASHSVNLAQGLGFAAIRASAPEARIGSAFSQSPCEPLGDTPADLAASERWHGLVNDWFIRPALEGRYPAIFDGGVPERRMGVLEGDMRIVRAPLDFLGVSVQTRTRVAALDAGPAVDDKLGLSATPVHDPEGPVTDMGWEIQPEAIYQTLMRLSEDFEDTELEITENGCALHDSPDENGLVHDGRRADFIRDYLVAVARAMDDGAKVRGYHVRALLDGFEWSEGFGQKFGLAWVDSETGDRA